MSPCVTMDNLDEQQPLSRTYQYRKVMKPMLERKRRARINKCLDELKDLMVSTLANEGENVTKLEKADVLELTVRHLRQLKQNRLLGVLNPRVLHDRYMAGFAHCASQVGSFIGAANSCDDRLDAVTSSGLLGHMSKYMQTLDKMAALPPAAGQLISPAVDVDCRVITPPSTPPGIYPSSQQLQQPVIVQCASVTANSCQLSPSSCSEAGSSICDDSDDDKVWRPW